MLGARQAHDERCETWPGPLAMEPRHPDTCSIGFWRDYGVASLLALPGARSEPSKLINTLGHLRQHCEHSSAMEASGEIEFIML